MAYPVPKEMSQDLLDDDSVHGPRQFIGCRNRSDVAPYPSGEVRQSASTGCRI